MKSKILIAGQEGMVGSSLYNYLKNKKFNIIDCKRKDLDFTNQLAVEKWFKKNKPNIVINAAGRVGGILDNKNFQSDYIYINSMIGLNIINSAKKFNVSKLINLGSACIYPKKTKQPIKEDSLLTGKLEQTNEPYAVAKIAGIKMCESYNRQYGLDYRSIMPTNLYGPGDNYHSKNSHVIPGLIHRFHKGKINKLSKVTIWGTGKPKREFLYVDDLAKASIKLMNLDKKIYDKLTSSTSSHINVGGNIELTIKELAENIKEVVGYKGKIEYDDNKPDGTPRKLLDNHRMRILNFKPRVSFKLGLIKTYQDYKKLKLK